MKLVKKIANKQIESSDLERISKKFELRPEIVELLFIRNIDDDDKIEHFLHPSEQDFHDPFLLSGMKDAVDKIHDAVKRKKSITIFGDYDVDGVSATALLILYFESIGFKVSHFMPNRYIDGYGLSNDAIDKIKQKFNTELLITVDCGISCHDEVEYAKSLGIDVIVTDHHDIPDVLPDTITVNAKLPNQEYPFKELCGTGVAFKLVQALSGIEKAKEYLSIACIATIADIVPLVDENRAIVKLGLENFFVNLPKGIHKLYKTLGLEKPNATEISFKLTPKINASGRMGSADTSLELYLEQDDKKIDKLISDIMFFNEQRQELCSVIYDQCKSMIENQNLATKKAIVLCNDTWDSGILGIVSARLTEEYYRPTFLFANDENDICSGSGRSIPNLNIHFCLNQMKDMLESFGGHTMAAGVKIKREMLGNFEKKLNEVLTSNFDSNIFVPQKKFDIDLDLNKIDKNFVKSLDVLEPLGSENPRPLFKIQLCKSNATQMKNHPNHLTMNLNNIKTVGFNLSKWKEVLNQNTMKDVIVELGLDRYKGNESTRMFLKSIAPTKNIKVGDNEKLVGEYLMQLQSICTNVENKMPEYSLYDYSKLKSVIENFDKANGTLFVAFTYGSFSAFTQDEELDSFVSSYYYKDIIENQGHNSLVLCPDLENDFKNYNNIIILDAVLDKNYIATLNQKTNAKIFVPKNLKIQSKLVNDLNLDRSTFGEYYNLMRVCSVEKNKCKNLDEFYQFCKTQNSNITFVEFVFVKMVMQELGILEEKNFEGYVTYIFEATKTSKLENSKIYCKAKELKTENAQ